MKEFLLIFFVSFTIMAQPIENGFNFFLPSYDSTKQNFLPYFAPNKIENDDFVTIDNEGHFSVKGKRIKFWSSNLCDEQVFPAKQYAGLMVGRIRKFGFNLMRFHYFDARWGNGRCIFPPGEFTRTLDEENLDRMEYLISKFKENGIYIDMNLHVARKFSKSDGVIDADSLVDFGKAVTLFDPQLIDLQKEYARQLLTHVNPYTGLALVDDPVMAMLEITNENWFFHYWNSGALKPLSQGGVLTSRHNKMLEELWNEYLVERFKNTEELSQAWGEGSKDKIEYIDGGDFEDISNTPFNFNVWDDKAKAEGGIDNSESYQGSNSYKVNVIDTSEAEWQINMIESGLTLEEDSTYVLTFYAKSTDEQTIGVNLQIHQGDYAYYGGTSFKLTENWKKYTWNFESSVTNINNVELFFAFGKSKGTLWLDNVSFFKTYFSGLKEGESLELKNIERMYEENLKNYTTKRSKTLIEFLINLQENYYNEMKRFLKEELKVKVPISGSNFIISYADTKIQNNLDYIDQHAYWDHPWNDRIQNNSMLKDAKNSTIGYLFSLSAVSKKPFTISEYSHVYPNRYQTEFPFFLAAYGAFQDADALMSFGISEGSYWGEGNEKDMLLSNFNIGRNNVLMSFMPTFAYAYREKLISPSASTIEYTLSNSDIINLFVNNDEYQFKRYPKNFPISLALTDRIRIKEFDGNENLNISSLPPNPESPYVSNTGEITWDENGLLKIETQKLNGIVGFLNEFQDITAGKITVKTADKFSGVTLLSLDEKPIQNSEKMILTVGTRQLNSGTVWNSDFTSLINKGSAPTIIEPVKISFEFELEADSLRVTRLNTLGEETEYSHVYYPVSNNKFAITIDQSEEKSLWFGLETKWENKLTKRLKITFPQPEEEIIIGDKYNLIWEAENIDRINLYFKLDSLDTWTEIAANINASEGKYEWEVPQVSPDSCIIKIEDVNDKNIYSVSKKFFIKKFTFVDDNNLPGDYALRQNYPNPFNPSTTISYSIPNRNFVNITLYDALGKKIETLVNRYQHAGNYKVKFNGVNFPSGIYFYQIKAGKFVEAKKMLILK